MTTAHRIDEAGVLVDTPGPPPARPSPKGLVVASFQYQGSKTIPNTSAGQQSLWKPKIKFKANHTYWVVGAVTLRWVERGSIDLVVWRSVANIEIQKITLGGGREDSEMLTTYPTYISAMFTPTADIEEELWFVVNTPADPKATGTRGMWLYDNPGIARSEIWHNIYVIDCGLTPLPPDPVPLGHRIDEAGVWSLAPVDTRPGSPIIAGIHDSNHKDLASSAVAGQMEIMSVSWSAKPNHQYLVIAVFTGIMTADNNRIRDFWLYDQKHSANPARTRLGTYAGPSHNATQSRPVALVAVLDGSDSAAVYGNRQANDGEWLTMQSEHVLLVFDLGEK